MEKKTRIKDIPDRCVDARAGRAFEWEADDEIEDVKRRATEENNEFCPLSGRRGRVVVEWQKMSNATCVTKHRTTYRHATEPKRRAQHLIARGTTRDSKRGRKRDLKGQGSTGAACGQSRRMRGHRPASASV
jgi:hypothetical protein